MSDVLNLPNSIWPNGIKVDDEGYAVFYPLGTNKIEVPTDSSSWPTGDKLVSPFVYQNDRLVGFCDTMAMTVSGNTTITMPYEHIEADFSSISEGELTVNAPNAVVKKFSWSVVDNGDDNVVITLKYKGCETVADIKAVDPDYLTNDIVDGVWSEGLGDLKDGVRMFYNCITLNSFSSDLSNLTNGESMFYATNLTSFTFDLPSLTNGFYMFRNCPQLTTFSSDLSNLTNGYSMFQGCENLTSFSSDLRSLTNGERMFTACPLTSFSSDLPNLTNGGRMFADCSKLTTFSSDLSSLNEGDYMFSSCANLTSFSSDLSSLTITNYMFYECSNLTSFSSDLPNLTNGSHMFYKCKLDAPSVKNIINTINTINTYGSLTLGMGCDNTTTDKKLFAQEVGYVNMTTLLTTLKDKGWTVTAQYNGRPTTTYGLRRPTEDTLPVFVKLEETEDHAYYTSEDGSKKYRLDWFHETTGSTEGYAQFNSLEEAIEHFNIKPIERN